MKYTTLFLRTLLCALLCTLCFITLTACSGGGDKESEAQTIPDTPPEEDRPAKPPAETSPETEALTEVPAVETKPAFESVDVQNPVLDSGADPWVIEHEGHYYFCFAFFNGIGVSEFDSLHEISHRGAAIVYAAPEGTAYSHEYWAPELHYLNGEWYIYVAASDGSNETHRMYVLKGTSQNPLDPFVMVGQITDPSNRWAIDGTVLTYRDELYFVWSGWEGYENGRQDIYIAHMSDPCTIDSERVLISSPVYSWEKVEWPDVNEGPTALVRGDDVFIVYSASGSWTDSYCLGMLTLTGDDPLNPRDWRKSGKPVFKRRDGVAYGPGHCSFAPAKDGSIWMIYHANKVSGTGWDGRSVWLAPVTFDKDGVPQFGRPEESVSFPVPVEP